MKTNSKVWIFYNSISGKKTKPMSTVQAQMTLLEIKGKELASVFVWTPGWEEWQPLELYLQTEQKNFIRIQPPKPQAPKAIKQSEIPDIVTPEFTQTATQAAESTNTEITKTVSAIATKTKTDISKTVSANTKPKVHSGKAEEIDDYDDADYTEISTDEGPNEQVDYGYFHQDFNGNEFNLSQIKKISKKEIKEKPAKASTLKSSENRRNNPRHNFKIEVVVVTKEKTFRTYSKNISLGGTMLEDEIPKEFLNKPFDLIIINNFENDPKKRRLLFNAKIVGDLSDPRRLMFFNVDPEILKQLDALLKAYLTYKKMLRKQAV